MMTDYERGRLAGYAEGVEALREHLTEYRLPAGASLDFAAGVRHHTDHVCSLRALRAPSPATGRDPRCTCGSGGHPRRCALHPEEFDRHCAELNEDGQADLADTAPPAPSPKEDTPRRCVSKDPRHYCGYAGPCVYEDGRSTSGGGR